MSRECFPVGVIGLGAMGGGIARRLLQEGWPVVVFDPRRSAIDAATARGARAAHSPLGVAADAELVITSLPGEGQLRDVVFGDRGLLAGDRAPATLIDMSTIAPEAAISMEGTLAPRQVAFLDAPVSGGPGAALSGSLTIMVGRGDAQAGDHAAPVLRALGSVFLCGGPGAGQVCKACNQLVVVGTIELVAEALALASAAGLDPALVRSALMGGFAASRVLELHGARMLDRDFEPGGRAKFNLKDIDAIRGLATSGDLALPAFEAAAMQIRRLVETGGGDLDNSALITVIEHATAGSR